MKVWLPVLYAAAGWGGTWAIGLSAVYYWSAPEGWILMGVLAGAANAMFLRRLPGRPTNRRLLLAAISWIAGGLLSAAYVTYAVLPGWLGLALPGASVTAWAAGSRSRIATALVFLAWFGAGVAGWAGCGTAGKAIGMAIAGFIGGRAAPYLVWSIAWGVGGLVTGLIGALVTLRFSPSA